MTARALLLGIALLAACADPAPPPTAAPSETGVASVATDTATDTASRASADSVPAEAPAPEPKAAVPSAPTAPASAAPGTEPAPPADGRYAVLVGIDDYPGDASDLPSGAHDLRAMRALLVGRFGYPAAHVLTLQDRRATRGAVRRAIRDHLGRADVSALLYVSGHGVRLAGNVGRADAERDGRDEALYVWADDGRHSALVTDDEVGAWMGALPARHAVVVLDACHSGTGARGGDGPKAKEVRAVDVEDLLDPTAPWTRPAPAASRTVVSLAAARDREVAFSGTDGEPSVFTAALTDVLGRVAAESPLADAMREVSDRVRAVSRAYGSEHHPQFDGGVGLTVHDVFSRPH